MLVILDLLQLYKNNMNIIALTILITQDKPNLLPSWH